MISYTDYDATTRVRWVPYCSCSSRARSGLVNGKLMRPRASSGYALSLQHKQQRLDRKTHIAYHCADLDPRYDDGHALTAGHTCRDPVPRKGCCKARQSVCDGQRRLRRRARVGQRDARLP